MELPDGAGPIADDPGAGGRQHRYAQAREKIPASGELIAELFRAGGLSSGVLEVVHGPGTTGGTVIDADVDRVLFTGSVATGRCIAARCGERLIPCTLKLGGKEPAIVLADADLDQAADGLVWGAFANAGQICASVERVYAVEQVADALTARIVARTEALRLGPDGDVGSVIDAGQRDLIAAHVTEAVDRGARVLSGGHARDDVPGTPFEPTALVDVPPDARILREETFGPVLPIVRVADADEAVALANDTEFGLTASIWTCNRADALRRASAWVGAGSVDVGAGPAGRGC
nr:aldehyde dehydrogenase family protein [Mycobacterium sp.]